MTSWELGNDIMCNMVDKMRELSNEAKDTHPQISDMLYTLALDFGPLVNRLMNDDHSDHSGMCPMHEYEDEDNGKIVVGGSYRYFDGTSEKVWDPTRRIR